MNTLVFTPKSFILRLCICVILWFSLISIINVVSQPVLASASLAQVASNESGALEVRSLHESQRLTYIFGGALVLFTILGVGKFESQK